MKKTNHGKSLIIFAGGVFVGLSALLMANAYTITTNIQNAVQYLMRTVITTDGSNTANTLFDVNYNTSGNVYIKNNLGIGTTGPIAKLDVSGSINTNVGIMSAGWITATNGGINSATTNGTFPNIVSSETVNTGGISIIGGGLSRYIGFTSDKIGLHLKQGKSGEVYLLNSENYNMYLGTSGRNDMTITNVGNIGIGTTTPTSKLQVVGLPAYTGNAAAQASGLTVGAFYRVPGDPSIVAVVY